jgi:hypothetical protein
MEDRPMEPQIVETTQDARQGRRGLPVFYVLTAGITLVVIAFGIIAFLRPW